MAEKNGYKSRSSASTTIVGFGKVVVGVRLYSTAKDKDERTAFNSYHATDMGRARSKLYCEICGEDLPRNSPAMVKGKDVGAGQIIPFTDEELQAVRKTKSGKITISKFRPARLFTPDKLGKAWYVGTAKDGGAQPFKFLHTVMSEQPDHVAQVHWVNSTGHDVHGIMSVHEGGFLIQEIVPEYLYRPFSTVEVKEAEVPSKLVPKGLEIIQGMKEDAFDHHEIVDAYPAAVDKLTGLKQLGETIPVEELPQVKQESDDLEAMLDG